MNDTQKRRILFVDDEPPVLNLLQTLFRHANPEWESAYADRGAKALALMAEQPFDMIVSDMRMPEMSGADLLERVRNNHPETARVVLSGYADQPMSIRALSAAHQYLAKPFTLNSLQSTLNRVFALDQVLPDRGVRRALARLHHLPTGKAIQARVTRELNSPAVTSDTLGGLVAQDPALSAKALQITNSAFFNAPRHSLLAKDAVVSLGTPLLRTLVTANALLAPEGMPVAPGLNLDELARHGVAAGLAASRVLAADRALPDVVKAAFTAGVLHDIGKLALACAMPEVYGGILAESAQTHRPLVEVELERLGATHSQAGAYILGLWGLPESIVEVVLHHHSPTTLVQRGIGPLAAVHVANALCQSESSDQTSGVIPGLDLDYLAQIGVTQQRLNVWLQAASAS